MKLRIARVFFSLVVLLIQFQTRVSFPDYILKYFQCMFFLRPLFLPLILLLILLLLLLLLLLPLHYLKISFLASYVLITKKDFECLYTRQ